MSSRILLLCPRFPGFAALTPLLFFANTHLSLFQRPWHVFVDTSPDTDADFEVAATFDEEPSGDDVNFAIVECLEGSEREDELVAQQMQQALEDGQLDQVSEMLGISTDFEVDDSEQQSLSNGDDEDDDDDNFYNDFDMFEEDSC